LTRSEAEILLITIIFQVIAFLSLLRVATGVASQSPPEQNSSTPPIVTPTKLSQNISIPTSTPQFVSPGGGSFDASLILVLVFVAANVVVIGFLAYLYKKKRMKWFSLLISLFLVFNVTELYFTFLSGIYSIIPIIAAFAALAITILAALRGAYLIINALAFLLALELGSSFPVLLQAPLNWLIPLVYAIFDVYAVYYGRLGKLVRQVSSNDKQKSSETMDKVPTSEDSSSSDTDQSKEQSNRARLSKWPDFGLLSIRLSDIEIGMADVAFYTMVPAVALILTSIFAFIVVLVAVDIGIVLSFTLLRKSEVAPGLPIPILMGLGALLLVNLI
jgi:hypothetical protein